MIRLSDATMLALTKLRTRKVRLIITIVVSGLLFGGLAGASIVARGVMEGVSSFSKEGLGERYITQATPELNFSFMNNAEVLDRALAIQKDTVARKKAEAKRLDVPYDPTTDGTPVQQYTDPSGNKQRSLDSNHPAAQQAINEYLAAHPLPSLESLKKVSTPYNPAGLYESRGIPYDLGGIRLQVLKDGKEIYTPVQNMKGGGDVGPNGIETFVNSWSIMSSSLLEPFILPGQNLKTDSDGTMPIIVPRSAAEQLLQLKALPASAPAQERLERTKEIRTKATAVRFSVCYRNKTSVEQLSTAVSTKQEMEQKKDFQKPDLMYGLPTEACGSVPIIRDVRSYDDKDLAARQQKFDQAFGTEPADQSTLKFRIVGIVPDPDYGGGAALGVGQIVRSLVVSSLGSGWYAPAEELNGNAVAAKLFTGTGLFGGGASYYAEFPSPQQARQFIDKEACKIDYTSLQGKDMATACSDQGHLFNIYPYGSNSLALESAKRGFGKFFRIAALAVSVIACIIMMGTVGRMIADSRRETAVFRAIGAKKLDISQIYIVYSICLALLISLFAIALGTVVAYIANTQWSEEITVQALTAYNAQDLTKTFSLYAFYLPDMLLLIGLSLTAALLSAVFPLFRNLRRNPIRDMRDDT